MSSQDLSIFHPVLDHLKISSDQLIGKGGEGYVFNLGGNKVVKIYKKSSQAYLKILQKFQQRISSANLPYQTPVIESIHELNGIQYSIESKLAGRDLESTFAKLSAQEQTLALKNYLAALKPLKNVPVNDLPFGQVLDTPHAITSKSWKEFILNKLNQKLEFTSDRLRQDVVDFELKLKTLVAMAESMLDANPEKCLVHGDYYLNNVLVNKSLEISAVLDISDHTCVGDRRLDVANINFLSLCENITPEHIRLAREMVIEEYGSDIIPYLDLYGFYYAFYFSNLYTFDMTSYTWCLHILNDSDRWSKYI